MGRKGKRKKIDLEVAEAIEKLKLENASLLESIHNETDLMDGYIKTEVSYVCNEMLNYVEEKVLIDLAESEIETKSIDDENSIKNEEEEDVEEKIMEEIDEKDGVDQNEDSMEEGSLEEDVKEMENTLNQGEEVQMIALESPDEGDEGEEEETKYEEDDDEDEESVFSKLLLRDDVEGSDSEDEISLRLKDKDQGDQDSESSLQMESYEELMEENELGVEAGGGNVMDDMNERSDEMRKKGEEAAKKARLFQLMDNLTLFRVIRFCFYLQIMGFQFEATGVRWPTLFSSLFQSISFFSIRFYYHPIISLYQFLKSLNPYQVTSEDVPLWEYETIIQFAFGMFFFFLFCVLLLEFWIVNDYSNPDCVRAWVTSFVKFWWNIGEKLRKS